MFDVCVRVCVWGGGGGGILVSHIPHNVFLLGMKGIRYESIVWVIMERPGYSQDAVALVVLDGIKSILHQGEIWLSQLLDSPMTYLKLCIVRWITRMFIALGKCSGIPGWMVICGWCHITHSYNKVSCKECSHVYNFVLVCYILNWCIVQ